MRFVIVTGMSGAGKSTALKILEDIGYFCVDNLPIQLLNKFADLAFQPNVGLDRVALGVDIRSGDALDEIGEVLDYLDEKQYAYEIVFLDSDDSTLVKRYKETRRTHPLAANQSVNEGIIEERKRLEFLRQKAKVILNTSKLLSKELRAEMEEIFKDNKEYKNIFVTVMSFGFKNGLPMDADMVFDVRFMPNPYYVTELRNLTGNDQVVQEFVMHSPESHIFLEKLESMVDFLIPHYIEEGKNQLVIALGCTGGKHRSVTIANKLYDHLSKDSSLGVRVEHRDIGLGNHGTNFK